MDAFVSWGHYHKSPHTSWLKIIATYFLTVLGVSLGGSPDVSMALLHTGSRGESVSCLFQLLVPPWSH